MGWTPLERKLSNLKESPPFPFLLHSFHLLAITTLSLLLPLSFLLLARLTSAHFFLFNETDQPSRQDLGGSFLFSAFLYANPTLLHILVSFITLSALISGLTGRITLLPDKPARPRLHVAWVVLCTVQVCVGLGIEASIEAGVDGSDFPTRGRSVASRVVFFIGIHETMMHWSRSVVRPVVDDTLWGAPRAERWAERAAMAAGCGGLWWLRLREEVESLVGVVEVKIESMVGVGVGDFLGWWLYYLVVTIGMAKILKGVLWVGMVVVYKRWEATLNQGEGESESDHHSLVDLQEEQV